MHHDAAAASLACRPLPGPDRVCVCGGGGLARLVRELVAAAQGPGRPVGCGICRPNSPLALIAPPPSCLSAELGNGFEQPWVTWSSSSFNRLGPPRRGRSVSFRLLDLPPLAQLHGSPAPSHLPCPHASCLPSLQSLGDARTCQGLTALGPDHPRPRVFLFGDGKRRTAVWSGRVCA